MIGLSEKLTGKEITEIAIQTGLQAVPIVGSPMAAAYFATKQEKRFKRIENFYRELADKVAAAEDSIAPFNSHDEDSLIALIERINEEIEIETSEQKKQYFKNFFVHMLQTPTINDNFDERQMLLETLASITALEFQVLFDRSKGVLELSPVSDDGIIDGAISKLETLGLLRASYVTTSFVGQSSAKKRVYVSKYGEKFIEFCLD